MAEDGVGYLPALPSFTHNLILGYTNIGKKNLVEIRIFGHINERTNLNARGVHFKQQERDSLMLGGVGLCSNQAEDPIGQVSRAGPDLLAIDNPLVTVKLSLGSQAGQVTARSGFGISLAPDDFTLNGWFYKLLLLLLGTHFQKHRRQHRNALATQTRIHTRGTKLFGNNSGFDDIGLRAIPPVLPGDRARVEAVFDQQLLPRQRLCAKRLAGFRLLFPIFFDELANLITKSGVFAAKREIHKVFQ